MSQWIWRFLLTSHVPTGIAPPAGGDDVGRYIAALLLARSEMLCGAPEELVPPWGRA